VIVEGEDTTIAGAVEVTVMDHRAPVAQVIKGVIADTRIKWSST
jgi:hypothetical protein